MFVYLSIPAAIIFLWLIDAHYKIGKDIVLTAGMIYLFLTSSFRSVNLGADSVSYIRAFNIIGSTGSFYMEKGYVLLNRIVYCLTSSYSALIFVVNCFFFISVYYYIRRFVDKEYWIYCLIIIALQPYIYLQTTFNIIRQCCAVSFVISGLSCYINSVKFKHKFTGLILFCLLTLIGAQFHKSAYFLLVIPLLLLVKMNRRKWRMLAIVFLLCNLLRLTRRMTPLLAMIGYSHYSEYSSSILDNPAYLLVVLGYFFWITSSYNRIELDDWKKHFYDLYLFSIAFLLLAVSNDMFYRVYVILAIITMPAIQIIVKNDTSKRLVYKKKFDSKGVGMVSFVLCSYYVLFFVGYILYLGRKHSAAYIPYHSVFWKG